MPNATLSATFCVSDEAVQHGVGKDRKAKRNVKNCNFQCANYELWKLKMKNKQRNKLSEIEERREGKGNGKKGNNKFVEGKIGES